MELWYTAGVSWSVFMRCWWTGRVGKSVDESSDKEKTKYGKRQCIYETLAF